MTRPAAGPRRPPIRLRLALWSTAGLLVVMGAGSAAMVLGLRDGLRNRAHESLEVPFRVLEHQIELNPRLRLSDLLEAPPPIGERHDEVIGQILDSHGRVVDGTGQEAMARPVVGADVLADATNQGSWHEPRHFPGRQRDDIVVVVPIRSGPRAGDFVVLAQTLRPTDAEVQHLIDLLAILVPVTLLASLAGGWWIARALLAPVDALTRQATLIDPEGTDTVLPVPPGDDEVSRLAKALNDMLGRLRLELDRQRRFTADASHELRTPLALMTANLEVTMRSASTRPEALSLLESLHEDATRLGRIVEDLLVLSRAEAGGEVALAPSLTDLLELAVATAARFRPAATAHGISIVVHGSPVMASVDPHLFGQAVANLVDNAVKYSPPGGTVTVDVSDGAVPTLSVADQGIGIPPDEMAHVFERFHQVDAARRTSGSGLGLAIVESIVRAHRGEVDLESTPGVGSRFTIRLPADPLASPEKQL